MARKPTPSARIRTLLDTLEPEMKAAFLGSIEDIKSSVKLNELIARLEVGDIDGAVRAVNVEPAAYRAFQKAIGNTFEAGGVEAATKIPRVSANNGSTALFRFDIEHPTAAQDLRLYSSNLITGNLVPDQVQSIRNTLADGISKGRAPRRTALDVVGRINPLSGRREGGIIGLTGQQTGYVNSFRERLASGDPEEMKKIFAMTRRDKRFDATIRNAIASGKPLDAATIDKMAGRYSDKLLLLRGETIARTETMTAFNRGQISAMQQAINDGRIDASIVVKIWHAFIDERTRFTHAALNKKQVGFYEKFKTARGAQLMHPGDPSGGANEIVNCRCWMELKIDFLADLD